MLNRCIVQSSWQLSTFSPTRCRMTKPNFLASTTVPNSRLASLRRSRTDVYLMTASEAARLRQADWHAAQCIRAGAARSLSSWSKADWAPRPNSWSLSRPQSYTSAAIKLFGCSAYLVGMCHWGVVFTLGLRACFKALQRCFFAKPL